MPIDKNLPLFAAAVLVWLPEGERPDMQSFDPTMVKSPPVPNPEPWWLLHEAITHARTVQSNHNKLPWIKTGDRILSPQEIIEIHRNMGDLSGQGSNASRS